MYIERRAGAVGREALVSLTAILTLPNIYFRLRVPVVFQSYSLPLRSEHLFTLHHSAAQNQTGTCLVCEQKAYLV